MFETTIFKSGGLQWKIYIANYKKPWLVMLQPRSMPMAIR